MPRKSQPGQSALKSVTSFDVGDAVEPCKIAGTVSDVVTATVGALGNEELSDLLAWINVRRKRYDSKPGGLGRK